MFAAATPIRRASCRTSRSAGRGVRVEMGDPVYEDDGCGSVFERALVIDTGAASVSGCGCSSPWSRLVGARSSVVWVRR